MSPTWMMDYLLAFITFLDFCFIIHAFICYEICLLLMFRTKYNVLNVLEHPFFSCHNEYDPSPTEIEKNAFFCIFSKKYYFLKFIVPSSVLKLMLYTYLSYKKKSKHFRWILMVYIWSGIKGVQKVKKIREKRNSFYGNF